ncbi:hypothetical protein CC86DRAFT_200559 [Ophiobolus disseminans]|uniref:Uncharacterized protein n=1 Tax=Ophiobolus disseminans TaxID=1469910 RepID=A0A6A7A4S0_9PLEO|nr:hypothetical protein CC86DRAFT_200559 [Ophiobolus disseminans]
MEYLMKVRLMEHVKIQSCFILQHGFDDDEDEDAPQQPSVCYEQMESRHFLCHGDDTDEEMSIAQSIDQEQVVLNGDMLTLADIAIAEMDFYHDISEKVSATDMAALREIYAYGREVKPFDGDMDIVGEAPAADADSANSESISSSTPATAVQPEDSEPSGGNGQYGNQQYAPGSDRAADAIINTTIAVADFLNLLSTTGSSTSTYTKLQIIQTFATYSICERAYIGLEPLENSANARHLLESTMLKHMVRIGVAMLVNFLNMVDFGG